MNTVRTRGSRPLRLWPGVVAALLLALIRFGAPLVSIASAPLVALLGGFAGAAAIVVWWAFFSRAPSAERWGAVGLMVVALAATPRLLHESVAMGNLGLQFFLYAVPTLSLVLVVWAVASRDLAPGPRRVSMVAAILLASGVWTLVRSDGVTGDGVPEFAWRWSATAEERLLAPAATADTPGARPPAPAARPEVAAESGTGGEMAPAIASGSPLTKAEWPGLRGPQRDGVVRGVRIETDWASSPPVELWRRPIGPGVSSFAVQGDLLYTQEQRGEDEIVAAYHVKTGKPIWKHRDASRFWDAHVGAGPRATPAVADGRVYALGAKGILNALDADSGDVVWSRNAASDAGAELPLWGFVSSPLVIDDVVIVYTDSLAAYDLATGEPRWTGPGGGGSHSSPQLLTIDGVAQVALLANDGLVSVAAADGKLLWEHPWPGVGIVQPVLTAAGDILFSMVNAAASPIGTRRIAVAQEPGGWTTEERWTSSGLKPSFSSVVVHDGHAFGFDGRMLASIDVEDGERNWKGGRYGSGQLLLVTDQALLLVVAERGDLALVEASPDGHTELARFPAIAGKTWSQPALAGDTLLVRNRREMAAFRLAMERSH
ncbi:MAG: PQQ-like beta-propeller repeat protein [Acidobacteria bacterium]|nr:PQQ-like beta-propeller repeat protein [Acidobacteriota bacterium]